MAGSPDGKTLASGGSDDTTVRLWDAAGGQVIRILQGHQKDFNSVAWSEDRKTLASGSDDTTVPLWDVARRQLFRILQGHRKAVNSVAWSLDGKMLASGSDDEMRSPNPNEAVGPGYCVPGNGWPSAA